MAGMKWSGLQMARVFSNGRLLKKYPLQVPEVPELWGWLSFRRGLMGYFRRESWPRFGRALAVLWPCFGRGLAALWPRLTVGRVVGLTGHLLGQSGSQVGQPGLFVPLMPAYPEAANSDCL